ncbi:phosphatidylinositol-binding protein scs2 [Lodderomyces elongisporus]|uniref:phosphatidylinositol-binding protein scs2 n=1 Tax=Lodderomyces elongisporus TaxID=36914 RepID=UPI00291EE0CB|nr:phosphatidylinositol-binding protein scs2 [Lodderomyces elongisporus]WLF81780.1 phosphatidylinositol-binding protein scs2 [Lodderomyces elongisporus]
MEVSPNTLEFTGSFTKQITEYLTLSNPTNQPLAFKVKTTAPKLYCVRPNASVIEPGQSLQISIILQGFSQPLPSDYKCKDKFLLVSVPASPQTDASKIGELWPQLEAQNKAQVISKKLRVSYVIGQDKADTGATQNNNTNNTNNTNNSTTTTTDNNSNNHAAQNSSTGSPLAAGAAGVAAGGAAGYAASNHSHNHNQQPPQQQSYQQQQQQQPPQQQQSYQQQPQQQQQQPPQHQSNNSFGGYNQNQPFSQNGGSSSYGQGSDYGSQNRSFNDTSSINNGYNGGYQQQQPPLRQQQSYSQGGYDSGFGNHQQQQQQQQQPQSAVQRELEALARQVQTLSTKLEEKNSRSTSGSGVSAIVDSDLAANGISLPIALVLILVAFLVGWLVF